MAGRFADRFARFRDQAGVSSGVVFRETMKKLAIWGGGGPLLGVVLWVANQKETHHFRRSRRKKTELSNLASPILMPSPVQCSPLVVGKCSKSGRYCASRELLVKSAPKPPRQNVKRQLGAASSQLSESWG